MTHNSAGTAAAEGYLVMLKLFKAVWETQMHFFFVCDHA